MTMAEYVDEISFTLGGSVLDIEIEDQLPKCVNRAFREIKRYITTPAYMTVPFNVGKNVGATVDLSDKNVYSVIRVFRPDSYNSMSMNQLDVFGLNLTWSAVTNVNSYANRMLLLQQLNTISTDLDFIWDNHEKKLSVTMDPPFANMITIEYVPDYKDVEDIKEVYWVDWILKLATAYAKLVIGRIRSKYTLNSSQYSLDGETMLSEANQEIKDIQDFLRNNVDLAFPID